MHRTAGNTVGDGVPDVPRGGRGKRAVEDASPYRHAPHFLRKKNAFPYVKRRSFRSAAPQAARLRIRSRLFPHQIEKCFSIWKGESEKRK